MALDRPFDDGRVQTANVTVSASTVPVKIINDSISMLRAKRLLYLRHFQLDEKVETDVSGQRERRNTVELHTSGAKRVETRRGGVKW